VNLSAEDVQEILRLLDAVHLDELHLETDRLKLTLRRSADGAWTQQTQLTSAPALDDTTPTAARSGAAPPPTVALAAAPRSVAGLWEVRAPLLGTFYRAPKPGAPPFVEVGNHVEEDTVVGIVETMKLMNSVLAGASGRVAEICLDDAQFAEQGAVLLRIEPEATEVP
jgi:acetyl-CoA carboxylase biotin carboxyl carrier protein